MDYFGITPYNNIPDYVTNPSPLFPPQKPFSQYQYQGPSTGNPLFDMLVAYGGPMFAPSGSAALGFSGIQGGNLFNNIELQRRSVEHAAAMRRAAIADEPIFRQTLSGVFTTLGVTADDRATGFDPEQRLMAASRYGTWLGQFSPGLSNMFGGGRSTMALTSGIFTGGGTYIDPFRGMMGLNGRSAAELGLSLSKQFQFADDDPTAWRQRTTGFNSAQMGELFGEMSRRGLVSPVAADAAGNIDTSRVATQMRGYTKALSAIRELFGENGRPDAPIRDLFNALETLTSGANYQLDPQNVDRMVRRLHMSAKAAGVGFEGMARMAQAASSQAQALGLVAGPTSLLAAQDAFTYQAGMAASGMFATPVWGRGTPEQLAVQRNQLNVRNQASNYMNTVGALQRMSSIFGASSPRLRDWLEGIRLGVPPEELMTMDQSEIRSMIASETGMSLSQVESIFGQRQSNEEYAAQMGGGAVRSASVAARAELANRMIAPTAASIIARNLSEAGIGTGVAGAAELGTLLQGAIASAARRIPQSAATETAQRDYFGRELYAQLRSAAASNPAARQYLDYANREAASRGLTPEQYVGLAGLEATAQTQTNMISSGLMAPSDRLVNLLAITDPDAQRAQLLADARQEIATSAGMATAHTNMQSLRTRVAEALQEAGADPSRADAATALAKSFGFATDDKLMPAFRSLYSAWETATGEYDKYLADLDASAPTSEGKSREQYLRDLRNFEARRKAASDSAGAYLNRINKAQQDLQKFADEHGIKIELDKPAAGDSASTSTPGTMELAITNLNLNGQIVATNLTGTATPTGNRGNKNLPVATA